MRTASVVLTYLLVAAAYTWPLVTHLGTTIPHDAVDPILNTWILWWNTQAVPLTAAWWSPPIFFPAPGALAFSEHLLGLYPVTTPLQALGLSPLTTYNIVFLVSFPAAACATYWLCLRLTGHRPAAFLAGLYFGFAPYKADQLAHLQVLCVYGLPLVLLSLHAYWQSKQSRWLVLFGAAWLLLAASCGYYLFYASLLIVMWLVWFGRSRAALPLVARASGVWLAASLPFLPVLLAYHTIQQSYGFVRDREQIESYSADLLDVLTAPLLSLWSAVLPPPAQERALFPGLAVVIGVMVVILLRTRRDPAQATWRPSARLGMVALLPLALAVVAAVRPFVMELGFVRVSMTRPHKTLAAACVLLAAAACLAPPVRRAFRASSMPAFYLVAAAVTACLSLGPEAAAGGVRFWYRAPYAWLMVLPGWNGLRVPTRFWMLTSLCLAVLLAVAVSRLAVRWPGRRPLMYGVGALLVTFDIAIRPMPLVAPPGPLDVSRERPEVVIAERPVGSRALDTAAMYRMMQHGRPIVNGYSGHTPPHYRLIETLEKSEPADVLAALQIDRPILSVQEGRAAARVEASSTPAAGDLSRAVCAPDAAGSTRLRRLRVRVTDARDGADITSVLEDGQLDSGWRPADHQRRGDGVEITLEEAAPVCAVMLQLGVWPLQYPRSLEVLAFPPGSDAAHEAWSGTTSLLTLSGAVRCQREAPIVLDLKSVITPRLRLQLRDDAEAPWWIAEIVVTGPRPGESCPASSGSPAG